MQARCPGAARCQASAGRGLSRSYRALNVPSRARSLPGRPRSVSAAPPWTSAIADGSTLSVLPTLSVLAGRSELIRGLDHQSTLGAWVGETALKDKRGTMRNWRYQDGANYMFPEAEVRAVRKP